MVDDFDALVVFTPAAKQALQSVLSSPQAAKVQVLGEGIPDPYGQSMDVYRACRDKIRTYIEEMLND